MGLPMGNNIFEKPISKKVFFWAFLALFLILLGCFAYKGLFSRYLQDDYCYGKTIVEQGFFKGIVYPYFHSTEYNGNRYSLTLFAAIFEVVLGTNFQSLYALISILCWLVVLTFVVAGFFREFEKRNRFSISLLIASILLTFTFYLAPNLYHVLYWRNASLTYLTSLVINTFLFAWVYYQSKRERIYWFVYPCIFLVSLLAAGFSEVTAVWQITNWGMFFILNNLFHKGGRERKKNNGLILLVLSGALLGAILLVISPTNVASLTASSVKIADPITFVTKSFRFGFDFLHYSLFSKWLPFVILFLFGFTLKQFIAPNQSLWKTWSIRVIIIILFTYLISVASMMPSVLVRTAYPDERALFPPHFSLILAVFLIGYFTGEQFPVSSLTKVNQWLSGGVTFILVLGLFLYSVRMVPLILSDVSELRARASA